MSINNLAIGNPLLTSTVTSNIESSSNSALKSDDTFEQTLQQVHNQHAAQTEPRPAPAKKQDMDTAALQEKEPSNVVDEFLAWMQMSAAEKIRDRILKSMGLTEEDLANMEPEAREKIEQIIAEKIQEETKLQIEKELAEKSGTQLPD